jgi:FtsH-binding integral membrane protein
VHRHLANFEGNMSSRGPLDQQTWGTPEPVASPVGAVDSRAIFGQTMFLVAITSVFAALGAWVARDATGGVAFMAYIGAFGVMIGMNVARKARNGSLGMGLLFGFGLLLGIAIAPTIAVYAKQPQGAAMIWQAVLLTGLFIACFGTIGWATKRDLAPAARIAFFGLAGLLVVAIVGMLFFGSAFSGIYTGWMFLVLGAFTIFTMYDFQRMRRAGQDDVVMLAMSIFLDIFNVFLIILSLLGGGGRR